MALDSKAYLDLTGLQAYDTLIKAWANSANQAGYKTILKTVDGNTLNLYKKAGAILGTDEPDATVALGGGDIATQLDALASVVGATYNSSTHQYTLTNLDEDFQATGVVAALNELLGKIDIINGDASTAGSFAKAIADAIDSLDVTEFALAEKDANDIITIHGISETDGEIAVGNTAANDVTFAKVAATGEAGDVAITTISGVTGDNVQAALESLKGLLDNVDSDAEVTISDATTTQGYLKSYTISQGGTAIGVIDIPKDFLVKSGKLVTVEDGVDSDGDTTSEADGTYIKLVINSVDGSANNSKIYINVQGLIDVYTGVTGAEVAVSISNYQVSASIVDIDASKITYIAADATADPAVARESVKAALQRLDTAASGVDGKIAAAINALDADLDAVTDASVTDQFKVPVVSGVTEVDGVLTAVDSVDVDRAGAATAAYNAIGSIQTSAINALFS